MADVGFPQNLDGPQVSIMTFSLINVGKSLFIRGDGDVELEPVPWNERPKCILHRDYWHHLVLGNIFPNEVAGPFAMEVCEGTTHRPFNADERQKLVSGAYYLVLYGQVIYIDNFRQRRSRFCRWRVLAKGDPPMGVRGCVAWSTLGDGDPPKN